MPISAAVDSNLEEALRHVLDHPGSLIRLRLVVQIATAYGLESTRAQHLAIALEYFHSASLLFDDLPCMDNARERRGIPCAHLVYGESGAILAALGLINRAYALTWRAVSGAGGDKHDRVAEYVEHCLGVEGVLNGQSMDLHYVSLPHTRETTERIARGKTVALIRLTLVLPAMLGDATERELQLLERMAWLWGLAYQQLDDLKDLLQGTETTGKTAARDLLLNRPNTAAVLGIEVAVDRVGRLVHAGARSLRGLRALRAEVSFLEVLRQKLEEELLCVVGATCGPIAGARL
jgi:geranylgeranyl pyrophosphate synthase